MEVTWRDVSGGRRRMGDDGLTFAIAFVNCGRSGKEIEGRTREAGFIKALEGKQNGASPAES